MQKGCAIIAEPFYRHREVTGMSGMMTCTILSPGKGGRGAGGFTLLELLVVVAIICVLSVIAVPAFNSLYADYCLKAAVWELKDLFKDAKLLSIQDKECAIAFDSANGRAALYSGKGADGKWETGDEQFVRELSLSSKGGGLSFGYGDRGPVPKLAETDDGIAFKDNRFASDEGLVGKAGSIYIQSATSGSAMAMVFNASDFSCTLHRWDGTRWVKK